MNACVYFRPWLLAILVASPAIAQPATQPAELGPESVVLDQLVNLYEPVPFNHKTHAKMAEMWDGCTTCHHRTPTDSLPPSTMAERTQDASSTVPACRSCHQPTIEEVDLRVPSLKGAYHRQCLNCHKEWMQENACVICHKARDGRGETSAKPKPTTDDIVGRMHPPIPEPDEKSYVTRFTPAVGMNVTFRHKEHTETFGLKCVDCHHRDSCSSCHSPDAKATVQNTIRPGRTWRDSHEPCIGCHAQDRCKHCHYTDDEPIPASFNHELTGQSLDKDHANLHCAQCHATLKAKSEPGCGDGSCHKRNEPIAFPEDRPGPVIVIAPVKPIRNAALDRYGSTTQPTTSPTIRLIRDGGS